MVNQNYTCWTTNRKQRNQAQGRRTNRAASPIQHRTCLTFRMMGFLGLMMRRSQISREPPRPNILDLVPWNIVHVTWFIDFNMNFAASDNNLRTSRAEGSLEAEVFELPLASYTEKGLCTSTSQSLFPPFSLYSSTYPGACHSTVPHS